jgi:ribosomal protein RSM22 (predicted rRNA methylase)
MPATYAAVGAALAQVARAVPGFGPASLLDLGGGTGAASWAATDVFTSIESVTVLDQMPAALELGRRLASARPVLRAARWEPWLAPQALPSADLVTVSYLLGELPTGAASTLVASAASIGQAVLVVEPGTPAGYGRVLAARAELQASGLRIVAPCPHESACPLRAPDWCHFGVRVNRSALHRRVKNATLGYEDEKYSYVCAVRWPELPRLSARVLRRPGQRKGLVQLRLCTPDGATVDELVAKRAGDRYRAARDVAWGDPWP